MSRIVCLSHGYEAIVDDDAPAAVFERKWSAQVTAHNVYAMRKDGGKLTLMHRLINDTPADMVTDHINGNGLDNRRANLRSATVLQNQMNRRGKKNGSSHRKGVWFDKYGPRYKPWRSAIRLDGRLKYLGWFSSEDAAGDAYAVAAAHYFGEFSCSEPGRDK